MLLISDPNVQDSTVRRKTISGIFLIFTILQIISLFRIDDIVTPQERDMGFMQALVNSGTVKAAFVGHNHGMNIKTSRRWHSNFILFVCKRKWMVLLLQFRRSLL